MKKTFLLIAVIGWAIYRSLNPMFISGELMFAVCLVLIPIARWMDKKESQTEE